MVEEMVEEEEGEEVVQVGVVVEEEVISTIDSLRSGIEVLPCLLHLSMSLLLPLCLLLALLPWTLSLFSRSPPQSQPHPLICLEELSLVKLVMWTRK